MAKSLHVTHKLNFTLWPRWKRKCHTKNKGCIIKLKKPFGRKQQAGPAATKQYFWELHNTGLVQELWDYLPGQLCFCIFPPFSSCICFQLNSVLIKSCHITSKPVIIWWGCVFLKIRTKGSILQGEAFFFFVWESASKSDGNTVI